MGTFDKYLLKQEPTLRRRIEIDISLYEKLKGLSDNVYDASVNKLVNIAIIDMVEQDNVELYSRPEEERTEPHNFLIREGAVNGLEKLKAKYGLSIFKLVNIAIYNALYK